MTQEIVFNGWRSVHVGFANDGLAIAGQDVWKSQWRDQHLPNIDLPHPAYPHQRHQMDIYEIGPLDRPVRFATGELSNGVWGFYVPA